MKNIYFFGNGTAEGAASDKNLLGGKGANLAEMTNLGIPVPPGFTISTDICRYYMEMKTYPNGLKIELQKSLKKVESAMKQIFGDPANPLLVSVRSGARQSMPGMMETVLNIGLSTKTIPGLIKKSKDERFVYDAYRRLITMYADVVMEKAAGIELKEGYGIREQLDEILHKIKINAGITKDSQLSINDLKKTCDLFKIKIKETLNDEFPDDPLTQLWESIAAVFKSWNGKRAISYREIENIPHHWGTAVNVQAMVFGNMGNDCATGVAFTRNPSTGENNFYGEWLQNAQGEDVVAGLRTPNPLNDKSKTHESKNLPSLKESMPETYDELYEIQNKLEKHFKDMQDIEFTIQNHKLWMLQTRNGKRNGAAAIRMAVEMNNENLINEKTALMRVNADHLDEIMHPTLDTNKENDAKILAMGLPAGPGGASGQIVFTADDAKAWRENGKQVILVRSETSPEDVHGMYASEAILTSRGGMTSHAALVARGWGKCCVVGCSELSISTKEKSLAVNGTLLNEGDWLTLNGSSGKVYPGKIPLQEVNLNENPYFQKIMEMSDRQRKLEIRTNADSPKDAMQARNFGAKGIGLCRTEHMFFDPERISAIREMIVANNEVERRNAIMKLLPFQKTDFYGILKTMAPYPVTIRLLDPPLHEFLPQEKNKIIALAKELKISHTELEQRIENLHELNPMLGHRGCRLGISYPEITEMQARAIFEASAQLVEEKKPAFAEIMIPLVSSLEEFKHQKNIIEAVAKRVQEETNTDFKYIIGTMIELPRACIIADSIAKEADFFSFGTNDLTQTTFGFSRDDIGGFLPDYLDNHMLPHDPFQSIDQDGVGALVKIGVKKGRQENPNLKIGICGEHGGEAKSIQFFNEIGLNYVSCSPYRVPIARLAAAQSEIIKQQLSIKGIQ